MTGDRVRRLGVPQLAFGVGHVEPRARRAGVVRRVDARLVGGGRRVDGRRAPTKRKYQRRRRQTPNGYD